MQEDCSVPVQAVHGTFFELAVQNTTRHKFSGIDLQCMHTQALSLSIPSVSRVYR